MSQVALSVAINLVNIAGVNGAILLRHMNQGLNGGEKSHVHHKFLKAAGYQLVDAQIRRRITTQRLSGPVVVTMQLVGYQPNAKLCDEKHKYHTQLAKQARCAFCPRENDKQVRVLLWVLCKANVHRSQCFCVC